MAKELNKLMHKQLCEVFDGLSSCVLVDYQGLVSEETYDLRRTLNQNQLRMTVLKNSIAKKALADLGIGVVGSLNVGPTAVVYRHGESDDPVTVSRTVVEWGKKHNKKLAIKGGILQGQVLDAVSVQQLANMPTRGELLSQILSCVVAPIQEVANVLNNMLCWVPNLVQNHIEKLETKTS